MSLLTLFSAPKAFTDPQIALIQNNAIASWARLRDVEILLMGDDEGVAEAASRVGASFVGEVRRNASGTPLISSMIQLARAKGSGDLLCITNTDMILTSDLLAAARRVQVSQDQFVLLGRRWDLDVETPIDFGNRWEEELRHEVRRRGSLHRPAGSDFFVFPRECFTEVPDFAVGRAGWDNWMICKARQQKWPVIDATSSIMAVHQNHDYSHLPGGAPHYTAPESNENIRLAGGEAAIRYTVLDATYVLRDGQLERPSLSYPRFLRGIELFLRAILFFLPAKAIEEVARPKRWKKRILRILGR